MSVLLVWRVTVPREEKNKKRTNIIGQKCCTSGRSKFLKILFHLNIFKIIGQFIYSLWSTQKPPRIQEVTTAYFSNNSGCSKN